MSFCYNTVCQLAFQIRSVRPFVFRLPGVSWHGPLPQQPAVERSMPLNLQMSCRWDPLALPLKAMVWLLIYSDIIGGQWTQIKKNYRKTNGRGIAEFQKCPVSHQENTETQWLGERKYSKLFDSLTIRCSWLYGWVTERRLSCSLDISIYDMGEEQHIYDIHLHIITSCCAGKYVKIYFRNISLHTGPRGCSWLYGWVSERELSCYIMRETRHSHLYQGAHDSTKNSKKGPKIKSGNNYLEDVW